MSDLIDNLDLDLTGVQLTRPVIDNQTKRCLTGQVQFSKRDDNKLELVVPLQLDEPATSTDGKELQVGHKLAEQRILLTPTGGLTAEMVKEKLARFQIAVLDTTEPRKWGSDADYQGRPVYCKLAARADKDDPTRVYQDVKAWIAPSKAAKATAGSGGGTL